MEAKQDTIWCMVYAAEVSRYVGESFAQGRGITDEMMRRAHDEAEAAANWNAEVRREVAAPAGAPKGTHDEPG